MANVSTDAAIKYAIEQITEKYGVGAVFNLESKSVEPVDVVSTGFLSLDVALGGGGMPQGRICEIFGPESSGKTTLAAQIVAQFQKKGFKAAYIDNENALDPGYIASLGVNLSEGHFWVSQPDAGEEALNIVEYWIRSGAIGVVVVDSVDALTPQAVLDGEIGDSLPGAQARMMGQAMRMLKGIVNKSRCCLIFINQVRDTMNMGGYGGKKETTSGGRALRFYASIRMETRRIGSLKDTKDEDIGARTKITIVKNKVAPPFKRTEIDLV